MPLAPLSGVGRPRLAGRVGVIKGAFRRQTHGTDTDTDRQRNARPKPRTDQSGRLADRHTTIRPRTPPAHARTQAAANRCPKPIRTPPNSAGLKMLGLSQGTPCVPLFCEPFTIRPWSAGGPAPRSSANAARSARRSCAAPRRIRGSKRAPRRTATTSLRDSAIRLAEAGQVRAAIELFQAVVALDPSKPLGHIDEGVSWMRLKLQSRRVFIGIDVGHLHC